MVCEEVSCWWRALEREHIEDEMFHAKDLLLGVSVVGDVAKLGHVRRVDLLVFAAKKKYIQNSIVCYEKLLFLIQ
jgi:hypothetical protein